MRFGSTGKVLAKRMLKCYTISRCCTILMPVRDLASLLHRGYGYGCGSEESPRLAPWYPQSNQSQQQLSPARIAAVTMRVSDISGGSPVLISFDEPFGQVLVTWETPLYDEETGTTRHGLFKSSGACHIANWRGGPEVSGDKVSLKYLRASQLKNAINSSSKHGNTCCCPGPTVRLCSLLLESTDCFMQCFSSRSKKRLEAPNC